MNPVGKALWFIEAHLGGDASLADIAAASGVSRYQLLRAFGTATGRSVMRYVRARRLTEAARAWPPARRTSWQSHWTPGTDRTRPSPAPSATCSA